MICLDTIRIPDQVRVEAISALVSCHWIDIAQVDQSNEFRGFRWFRGRRANVSLFWLSDHKWYARITVNAYGVGAREATTATTAISLAEKALQ